jgi:uncharacterized protein (DUF4415 family)
MKKKTDKNELTLNVTQQDYEKQLTSGIEPEAVLLPGEHKFERGGFFARHNIKANDVDTSARNTKIAISIRLDGDILEYFKNCAEKPGSAPYQTLINQVLREYIEEKQRNRDFYRKELIEDDAFIDAVAAKIKQRESQKIVGYNYSGISLFTTKDSLYNVEENKDRVKTKMIS